jgi:5-formyltetrahydrofolate cyclo-ligase
VDQDAVARKDKQELRSGFLAARQELSADQIKAARAAIHATLLFRLTGCKSVAAFRPLRTEPGSLELLESLQAGGARVLVPVLLEDRDLDWAPWSAPDQRLGITAISAAEAVLVPAVAVDRRGVRLGRGGGSYDRALRRVRPGVPIVALLYDGEVVEELPADDWDVRVTAAVTPARWFDLPAAALLARDGNAGWLPNR